MSDLVFGGGSDMLRKGDNGSVWRVINKGMMYVCNLVLKFVAHLDV